MKQEDIIDFFHASKEGLGRVTLLLLTTLIVSAMMTALLYSFLVPRQLQVGEISPTSIRAPRDFLVEDVASTERRREEAERRVREVFTLLDDEKDLGLQLDAFFDVIKSQQQERTPGAVADSEAERKEIEEKFDVSFTDEEWEIVNNPSMWPQIEGAIVEVFRPLLQQGILADKRVLEKAVRNAGTAVLVRKSDGEEQQITNLFDVREATEALLSNIAAHDFGQKEAFPSLIRKLTVNYLKVKPNVYFNLQETKERIETARQNVEPIFFRIKQGELIVRAEDKISVGQLAKLTRLQQLYSPTKLFRTFVGYFLLALVTLGVSYALATMSWWGFKPTNRDLLLVSLTLLGSFALVHFYSILGMSLSLYFPLFGTDFFVYATPFAAGGILLEVTLGIAGLLMFLIPYAIFTTIFFENSLILLILIILGNAVGALCLKRCSTRGAFIRAGLRIAAINVCVVVAFLLIYPKGSAFENIAPLVAAVLGGLTSGVLGAGLAPIAEYLGRYVTDIKLLELASLDQPLLRELSLQAPGTWNHAMVLGQMGEVAANAIGANGLLTRVGAYYHDIGKAKKPAYFVENQIGDENRHDKLEPSMSALIVRSHVKDGMEMAKEHRLPQAVFDFIPQHHGTALMEYFYEKALKEAEEDEIVDENLFRYPGPKPQTKEAGILMLADGVEASSRTLVDPTPAKIQGLVQKQINRVFASGQLEECELTLKDLHQIAKGFTKVLTGIYHRRIEYSEPAEKTREGKLPKDSTDGEGEEKESTKVDERRTSDRHSSKTNGGEHGKEASSDKETNGEHKETLKRLGM